MSSEVDNVDSSDRTIDYRTPKERLALAQEASRIGRSYLDLRREAAAKEVTPTLERIKAEVSENRSSAS